MSDLKNQLLKKIFIASDHAGFELKKILLNKLSDLPWEDLGPQNTDSVDYPDYANKVVDSLKKYYDTTDLNYNADSESEIKVQFKAQLDFAGILICGSGQGMVIRANRSAFIRAALCFNTEMAELSRAHNNANVLCLGARMISEPQAVETVLKFLNTSFEGGRHERRVCKL
jgi:ribose 5-phosphate isomerase B